MTFATYPSLAGRTVFISGGATGIGADIVRAFAGNHARVAFVDVKRDEGEALAATLKGAGEAALFLRCDVSMSQRSKRRSRRRGRDWVSSLCWSTMRPMTSAMRWLT